MRIPQVIQRAAAIVRGHPWPWIGVAVALLIGAAALGWWGTRALLAWSLPEGDAALLPATGRAARPTRPVAFSDGCTASWCHTDLVRAPVVHAPIAEGACDACHADDAGDHTFPLRRTKGEACTACHDTAGHQRFQHMALSDEGCVACHDPHTSTVRGLLTAGSTPATCARCHPRTEGAVQHAPYKADRCEACHEPHGAENKSLLLGGAGEDNCQLCHAPVVQRVRTGQHRDLHGECLACHAAHASDQKSLLIAENGAVCTGCHADIGRTVAGAAISHDPVLKGERCVTCHDPHASGNPKMLRDTQAAICLSCHSKPVQTADGRQIAEVATSLAESPVVHGAIRSGDCSACHAVHGGDHEHLLRETVSRVLVGPYDIRNYALCFSCHDPKLAESSAATRFRDGDRNLHEVHLRPGEHTRSCAACHAVHASDQARLIAKTVNLEGSAWAMPMGFTVTEDGGRCNAACHEPLSYSRRPGGASGAPKGGAP